MLDSRDPSEGFDGESGGGNIDIVQGYLITYDTSCHIASFISSAKRLGGKDAWLLFSLLPCCMFKEEWLSSGAPGKRGV